VLCGNGKRSAATRSSGSTGAAEHAAANLGQSKEILMATADAAAVISVDDYSPTPRPRKLGAGFQLAAREVLIRSGDFYLGSPLGWIGMVLIVFGFVASGGSSIFGAFSAFLGGDRSEKLQRSSCTDPIVTSFTRPWM